MPKIRRHMFSLTTMVLYERSMRDVASLCVRSAGGLLFRELTPRDRAAFERGLALQGTRETTFQPVFGMKDVDDRLRRGERCFVCEDGDQIAGYIWFHRRQAHQGDRCDAAIERRDVCLQRLCGPGMQGEHCKSIWRRRAGCYFGGFKKAPSGFDELERGHTPER